MYTSINLRASERFAMNMLNLVSQLTLLRDAAKEGAFATGYSSFSAVCASRSKTNGRRLVGLAVRRRPGGVLNHEPTRYKEFKLSVCEECVITMLRDDR